MKSQRMRPNVLPEHVHKIRTQNYILYLKALVLFLLYIGLHRPWKNRLLVLASSENWRLDHENAQFLRLNIICDLPDEKRNRKNANAFKRLQTRLNDFQTHLNAF